MKRMYGLTIALIFSFIPFSQALSMEGETMNDVRSLSLGGVRALNKGLTNPASLSFLSRPQATIAVFNRFQMSELNTSIGQLLFPNRMIDAGLRMSYFGYEEYNLFSVEAGLSKKLNPVISLGAKLLYLNRSNFLNENAESGIQAGAGLFFQLSQAISLGLLAENLASTFEEKNCRIHLGINYQMLNRCNVLFECCSDMKKYIHLIAGFDYEITEQLNFRAGIRTNPSVPTLGAAYSFGRFSIALCFELHQTLGNSSAIEVQYLF